jgi:hypothetical protein
MCGAWRESLQDKQIQRALNHITLERRLSDPGHGGDYTQVDGLLEEQCYPNEDFSVKNSRIMGDWGS